MSALLEPDFLRRKSRDKDTPSKLGLSNPSQKRFKGVSKRYQNRGSAPLGTGLERD